jgi:hypothetical protein
MTREEAIYKLKNTAWLGTDKDREETEQAVDMAIKALEELPKRRKEVKRWKRKALKEKPKHEKWVSCSEKLPNKKDLYMVTLKTFSDDYRFIELFYYGEPLMPNCKVNGACWYRSDSEWGDVVYDDTDILAWMPLPMPYKEDNK